MNVLSTLTSSIFFFALVSTGAGLATVSLPASATKTASGEYNTMHAGLGAKGYDVVTYFTQARPVTGSDKLTADYGGATWQFSSAENLTLFRANPARYAPQFGGYCAWGASVGKLFDVDPVNGWKIIEGKLYLNFNADINATFAKDAQNFISKANQNWPGLNK
jgi:YHS domain-containing protein